MAISGALRSSVVLALMAKGVNAAARFGLLVIVEQSAGLAALGLLSLLLALSNGITFIANAESYRIYLLAVRARLTGFVIDPAFRFALLRGLLLGAGVAWATASQHGLPVVLLLFCLTEFVLQDCARSFLYNSVPQGFDLVHALPLAAAIIAALTLQPADPLVFVSMILLVKAVANLAAVGLCSLIRVQSQERPSSASVVFPPLDIILLSALPALYPAIERIWIKSVFGLEGLGHYAIVFAASGIAVMLFQAVLVQPLIAAFARGRASSQKVFGWAVAGLVLAVLFLAFRSPLAPVAPQAEELLALLLLVCGHMAVTMATLRSFRPDFKLRRWRLGLNMVGIAAGMSLIRVAGPDGLPALLLPSIAYLLFGLCLLQATAAVSGNLSAPD